MREDRRMRVALAATKLDALSQPPGLGPVSSMRWSGVLWEARKWSVETDFPRGAMTAMGYIEI